MFRSLHKRSDQMTKSLSFVLYFTKPWMKTPYRKLTVILFSYFTPHALKKKKKKKKEEKRKKKKVFNSV